MTTRITIKAQNCIAAMIDAKAEFDNLYRDAFKYHLDAENFDQHVYDEKTAALMDKAKLIIDYCDEAGLDPFCVVQFVYVVYMQNITRNQ